jgi:serine phosphatase RsbU (regulator of sigma subunit)
MVQRLFRKTNKPSPSPPHAQPMRPRRSISVRMRWTYLISSTLPLILVGTLLIYLNFRTQQETVYKEQVTLTSQAVREISDYITTIETQLLGIGHRLQPDTFRDQRNNALRELINVHYPNLRAVSIYTINRNQITHVSLERTYPPDTYIRRTDDPMILRALQGQGNRSDIYQTEEGQPIFTIALPLRDETRRIIGAIHAEISATPIAMSLRILSKDSASTAYLINQQHTIILESSTPGWNPPPDIANLIEMDEEDVQYHRDNNRVMIYTDGNDQAVLSIIAPITPGTWSVVVEQPLNIAFANVWQTGLLLGILVAVVGLLSLGVALLLSQNILRPLNALREGAVAIGDGHLQHRIRVTGVDEMGQLAHTFNHMAGQLQESLSEIEEQNDRLREGLYLARDIQMGLLPSQPPWSHDMLTVYAISIPAYEVGGDFYSYIALPNGNAAISVGDISGKGVGAALMMALTSSMVESQARQTATPADVLTTLNRLLRPRMHANNMNAALLYAIFDQHNHTMTVANAGMIAPMLIRRVGGNNHGSSTNHSELIEIGGMPIGAMPNALYTDVTIPLQPGDMVLFTSDGVVEAHNEHGEIYGFERLEHLLNTAHHIHTAQQLIEIILNDVQHFIGETDQHDDITLLAVYPTCTEQGTWNLERTIVSTSQPMLN